MSESNTVNNVNRDEQDASLTLPVTEDSTESSVDTQLTTCIANLRTLVDRQSTETPTTRYQLLREVYTIIGNSLLPVFRAKRAAFNFTQNNVK